MVDESKLNHFSYMWTTEKDEWCLHKLIDGNQIVVYSIVNEVEELIALVSDNELLNALIEKLLDEGNRVVDVQL